MCVVVGVCHANRHADVVGLEVKVEVGALLARQNTTTDWVKELTGRDEVVGKHPRVEEGCNLFISIQLEWRVP